MSDSKAYNHMKSGGYFTRRIKLPRNRQAGLSILPKIEKVAVSEALEEIPSQEEKASTQNAGLLDYGDKDNKFLS